MNFLAVFSAIVLCSVSWAQGHDTLFWQKDELVSVEWRKSKSFHSYYGLRASEQTWKEVGTKHKHFVVEAYWLKQESFVPDDSVYYKELAQLLFDVYEIEARIFQSQINNPEEDTEMLQRGYEDRARRKCIEILDHSSNGRNTDSIQLFRREIDDQLTRISRKNEPALEPSGFQLYVQLNATGIATSGTFHQYCSGMFGGGAGIQFGYKNILLSISHSRGRAKISDSLVAADFGVYPGNNVQFRQWWYQLGYAFFDYRRLNYAVFGGVNSLRMINRSNPDGSLSSRGPVEFNFSVAGQINYSFPPFSHDNQSETQLDLFVRGAYNHYNYLFEANGSGFSVQAGLQLKLRTLRFPKSEFQ